ncbi:hypothetical protein GCM10025877_02960 [Agromyces mangrovi Wang et al. 2018]|nr:hypothetical protein GCM10025877_02960 [Agromyces mangrovi]
MGSGSVRDPPTTVDAATLAWRRRSTTAVVVPVRDDFASATACDFARDWSAAVRRAAAPRALAARPEAERDEDVRLEPFRPAPVPDAPSSGPSVRSPSSRNGGTGVTVPT